MAAARDKVDARPAPVGEMTSPGRKRSFTVAIAVCLFAVVLALYAPVRRYDFVTLDDPLYVSENEHVLGGLTTESVKWALTTTHGGFRIPLTWLSYIVEVEAFGPGPGPHHVTNLVLHGLNAVLLFLLLQSMTGAAGRSAFVAALFAVHPLHVESVAWITERKDVLSTFFTLLAVVAYLGYVRKGGAWRYIAVAVFFTFGLAAKPMMVTLPFALLLLDMWPLGRAPVPLPSRNRSRESSRESREKSEASAEEGRGKPRGAVAGEWGRLVVEKLPLVAISVFFSVLTYFAQSEGGAVSSVESVSIGFRAGNSLVSYAAYIIKMLWPAKLSPFYSLADTVPVLKAVLAGAMLALVTAGVLLGGRRRPYLLTGWFWYLGTLVPVVGLVQVGVQAMADRFTYVPLIGLFIVISWGAVDLASRWSVPRRALLVPGLAIVLVLAIAARAQLGHWKDSVTFWTRATEITLDLERPRAHLALARVLAGQGRMTEAIGHLSEAARLLPGDADVRHELGLALASEEKIEEAASAMREAIRLRPDFAAARSDLGLLLARLDRPDEARAQYEEAIRLAPQLPEARNNLGSLLIAQERYAEAIPHLQEAVRLRPGFELAHVNLGIALAHAGRIDEAIAEFASTLQINPSNEIARRAHDELKESIRKQ